MTTEQELNREQLNRQDLVDNSIFQLVNSLVPEGFKNLQWNQEWIAEVREKIKDVLTENFGIKEDETDAFLMQFYPFLPDNSTQANFISQHLIYVAFGDDFWILQVNGVRRSSGHFSEGQTIISYNDGLLDKELIFRLVELAVN